MLMFTCTCTLGVLFIEHKRHFLIKYIAGVSMIHFFKLMHQHLEHSGAFNLNFPALCILENLLNPEYTAIIF